MEFDRHADLESVLGPAGEERQWHHIVERRLSLEPGNERGKFDPRRIHNTDNIISITREQHVCLSRFYGGIKKGAIPRQTVREWLNGHSYEVNYEYGLWALGECGVRR